MLEGQHHGGARLGRDRIRQRRDHHSGHQFRDQSWRQGDQPESRQRWMFTTTTTGGWTSGSVSLSGGGSVPALLDPANFPGGLYNSNTDDRAHKVFNLPGANVAVLQASAVINVVNGDHFRTGYAIGGGDPFAAGGTIVDDTTGMATFPNFAPGAFDISGCISMTCSIGFQLQSGAAAPKDRGLAIIR